MAIIQMNIAGRMSGSFQLNFTIYCGKRLIEEFLINKYNRRHGNRKLHIEHFDVAIAVKFEKLCEELLRAIECSITSYLRFWEQLDGILPDLNELHKYGLEIINNNKEVDELWKKITKINPGASQTVFMIDVPASTRSFFERSFKVT